MHTLGRDCRLFSLRFASLASAGRSQRRRRRRRSVAPAITQLLRHNVQVKV